MCNSILESSSKIHETHSYLSSHCEAEFAKRRIVHPPKRTWAGLMCKSRIIKGLTTVFLLCCVCVIINWFDLLRSGKAVAVFRRMIQRHPRPVFPLSYHSTGLLRLPRSGIKEPFEIWLSHKDQKVELTSIMVSVHLISQYDWPWIDVYLTILCLSFSPWMLKMRSTVRITVWFNEITRTSVL